MKGICSKCHKDWMGCECDVFHPNVMDIQFDPSYQAPVLFSITREKAEKLMDYFVKRAGYISHEFDPGVHEFMKDLEDFLR